MTLYCDQSGAASKIFAELHPEPSCIGSSPDVISEEALYKQGIANLERLGLIETYYPFAKKDAALHFDALGKLPKGSKRITWLGRMLLKKIGLINKEI